MAAEGVKNEPRPSDAPSVPSTERISIERQIPGEWIDRLLVAQCQLRADTPFEDAVTQLPSGARELMDDAAIGVCIPRSLVQSSSERSAGQIEIRLAPARTSQPTEP